MCNIYITHSVSIVMVRVRVKHHPNTVKKALIMWRNSIGIKMDIYYNKGIELALYDKEREEEVKNYLNDLMRHGYILEWYRLYRWNDEESAYILFKAFITARV